MRILSPLHGVCLLPPQPVGAFLHTRILVPYQREPAYPTWPHASVRPVGAGGGCTPSTPLPQSAVFALFLGAFSGTKHREVTR